MSSTKIPQENEITDPDELAGTKLKDLEQHISQRINRLTDSDGNSLDLDGEDSRSASNIFIPPYEPLDPYNLPLGEGPEPDYRNAYDGVSSRYQGINELLVSVHELSDLLTESVLNINIRLNSIEERIVNGPDEDDAPNKDKLMSEVKTLLQQNHTLMKQNLAMLKQAGAAAAASKLSGEQVAVSDPALTTNIINELQRQVRALEEHISRNTSDVKQKVDERHGQMREALDIRAKVLEKLSGDHRDYLNRHFFSLAILFIIILFISSALITNSIDRLSSFFTEQNDSLRAQMDELVQPLKALKGPDLSTPYSQR